MAYIFFNSGISQTNYDAILMAWDNAGYTNKDLGFATPLTYCAGQAARTSLTTTKGWTIMGDALLCPLPLNWLDFQAGLTDDNFKKAALRWTTASELNVRDFEVQRSSDGNTYQTISPAIPAKNTSGKNIYEFKDELPLIGVSYYRVLETDNDGAQSFSPIRSVNNLAAIDFKVFPNPVSSKSTINIITNWDKEFEFKLTDFTGRVVFQSLKIQGNRVEITGANLAVGAYYYECRNDNSSSKGKLILTD